MKKNLPALAVISAAILWSLDGYIRQNLFSLPSFLIISLEHAIGALIFLPLLIKGLNEIYSLNQQMVNYTLLCPTHFLTALQEELS